MFGQSLFREKALMVQAEPDYFDDQLRVTAPHEWLILSCFAVVAVAITIWGIFGSIERNLSADGLLLQVGERHHAIAETIGTVSEILVSLDENVEYQQPLVRINIPDIDWQLRLSEAKIDILEERFESKDAEALNAAYLEHAELKALNTAGQLILSPHEGKISDLQVAIGQTLQIGTPVAEIRTGQIDSFEAIVLISENTARLLKEEMKARIIVEIDFVNLTLPAEVIEISKISVLPYYIKKQVAGLQQIGHADYLVRLMVSEQLPSRIMDRLACRIDFILGTSAPFALLYSSGSDNNS